MENIGRLPGFMKKEELFTNRTWERKILKKIYLLVIIK